MLDGQQLIFSPHLICASESYAYGSICTALDVRLGRLGAAAVPIRPDKSTCTLRFCPGPDSDGQHMVHKAELVKILVGIHLIETKKRDWKADVAIAKRAHMPE
jgi:hypothetical protein